jgi:ATP adenylyltransferase
MKTIPIPDDLRYRVLSESGARCALCGATGKERALVVAPIIPESKGGRIVWENLRVLCAECHGCAGGRDDTAVRKDVEATPVPGCRFCSPDIQSRAVKEDENIFVIADQYPVTEGHLLIIPRRHVSDCMDLSFQERKRIDDMLRVLRKEIPFADPTVTGFNIGVNIGAAAGQTIFHAHVHLIPRRDGDTPDPRGGVRGVIPGKRSY